MTYGSSNKRRADQETSMTSKGSRKSPVLNLEAMSKATEDGWKRHEAEQRLAWMGLTPAERLAWLEEAKRFAELAKRSRRVTEEERQSEG